MLLWICLFSVTVQGCFSQRYKNFTLGANIILGERLIEKPGEYEQCYVDIIVHNSSTFQYGLRGATVTVLSGSLQTPPLRTKFSEGTTDSDGKVCIPVQCHVEGRVFVEKNGVRLMALNKTMQQRNLPMGFSVELLNSNEVIKFLSYAWGNLNGRNGPVYSTMEKSQCMNAGLNNNYFVFSYIAIPDQLTATPVPTTGVDFSDTSKFNLMWNYEFSGVYKGQTCYVKIKMKVQSTQASVTANSYETDKKGTLLGTFTTGPQYNPSSSDTLTKAACVQYRCPIVDLMGNTHNTFISGSIHVPGQTKGCCVRYPTNMFSQKLFNVNSTGFNTMKPLERQDNYGSSSGIYIHEDPQTARVKCFTGLEYLYKDYAMDVNTNYAFEYDCTLQPDCLTPPVVG